MHRRYRRLPILPEFFSQGIQRAAGRATAQALPISLDQMDTEVRVAALAFAVRVVMERAPEDGPIPIAFHPNRGSQDLFGGGEDIVHVIFCDLLCEDLCAQQMGVGSQETAKPAIWLTGGKGDLDEKPGEDSHAHSPFVDELNTSRGMA